MASSVVDICNLALTQLGQEDITSLTDDTKEARACNSNYPSARDVVLRAHRWNCASKRATLSELSDAPTWGFTKAFQIPSDFIRFASLDDLDFIYRIEGGDDGRVIVTDESTVNLLYIYRLELVPHMDELLKECIAARLAAEIAYKLTRDQSIRRDQYQIYKDKLSEAMFTDSLEAPVDQLTDNTFIDARLDPNDVYRPIDTSV